MYAAPFPSQGAVPGGYAQPTAVSQGQQPLPTPIQPVGLAGSPTVLTGGVGGSTSQQGQEEAFVPIEKLESLLKGLDKEDVQTDQQLNSLYSEALQLLALKAPGPDSNGQQQQPDFNRNLVAAVLRGEIGPAASTTLDSFVQNSNSASGNKRPGSRSGSRAGSRAGSLAGTPRNGRTSNHGTPRHGRSKNQNQDNNNSSGSNSNPNSNSETSLMGFDSKTLSLLIETVHQTEAKAEELCGRVRVWI